MESNIYYMIKMCEFCQSEFEIIPKGEKDRSLKKRFCSSLCAKRNNGLNNKGKKRTESYKKNLSEKVKGSGNPFFSKKHTIESKDKMSKSSKWDESNFRYYEFSNDQRDIFDGILISDGSLERPSRISSRLTLGFRYKQTIERIIFDLNNMIFCPIYEYKYIDKRNGNTITNFFTKSYSSNTLLYEYNRWYKEGVKIVPDDIKLSPLFCYWWYVCDGFISNGNIKLCTESFDYEYLEILIKKFKEIGITPNINSKKRLFFSKKETLLFLDYISKIKIQKEYEYKFK